MTDPEPFVMYCAEDGKPPVNTPLLCITRQGLCLNCVLMESAISGELLYYHPIMDTYLHEEPEYWMVIRHPKPDKVLYMV